MKLRDYQELGIEQCRIKIQNNIKRIIYFLATGGGKGAVIADLAQNVVRNNARVLIVVKRSSLVHQTAKNIRKYCNIESGIIMASTPMRHDLLCQVASIDSLHRRMDKIKNDFALVIVDEAHDSTSPSYKKVFDWLGDKIFIGMTATPFNHLEWWHDYVKPIGISQLRDQGHLAQAKVYSPPIMDTEGVRKIAGDFKAEELFNKNNTAKVIGDVVEHYVKYGQNKPAILFAINVNHSIIMAAAFNNAGIPAVHCDANHTEQERSDAIARLSDGRIKVLCNVNIFSTGVDIPIATVGIMARPTMSEILYVQQIGRLLRPHENKENAIILDHAGNTERHGLPFDERDANVGEQKEKTKKSSSIGVLKTHTCKECYFITNESFIICPSCGHEKILTAREIEHGDGELVEVTHSCPIKRDFKKYEQKGYKPSAKFFMIYEKYGELAIPIVNIPKWIPIAWRASCPSKQKCPPKSTVLVNNIYKCTACNTKFTAHENIKEIIE